MENSSFVQPASSMGIKYKTSGSITILLAKNSNRYRVQSNSFSSLNLAVEQLIVRFYKHYCNTDDFELHLGSPIPGLELTSYILNHFEIRQRITEMEVSELYLI